MLYLVPTPIGNLEDITLRAIRLFREAQVILTEDGRSTSRLLQLLAIDNQARLVNIIKHHTLNKSEIQAVLTTLKEKDQTVLLVTDAGTPGISDPALEIVKLAQALGVPYTSLPGATAVVPAVVNSGLVTKEFTFLGFLPLKKGRQKIWQEIATSSRPVVVYESVHRLVKFVREAVTFLEPSRLISFSREISKQHEEIWTGTVADLSCKQIQNKGEFVWVIAPSRDKSHPCATVLVSS